MQQWHGAAQHGAVLPVSQDSFLMQVNGHLMSHSVNPLGAMCIYICTRAPTTHRDEHIYMHTT